MNYFNASNQRQRGVILVISLLMIAVLALLASASINLGSSELLIVGNRQAERSTAAAADNLVEESMSDLQVFTDALGLPAEVREGIRVLRTAPVCTGNTAVPGFSLTNPLTLQHNYYEFDVSADDPTSGAQTNIHSGVRILQNADSC